MSQVPDTIFQHATGQLAGRVVETVTLCPLNTDKHIPFVVVVEFQGGTFMRIVGHEITVSLEEDLLHYGHAVECSR